LKLFANASQREQQAEDVNVRLLSA
jgi:hypothetical protein